MLITWAKPCKMRRSLERRFLSFGNVGHGGKGAACKVGFRRCKRGHGAKQTIVADVVGCGAKPAFAVGGDTENRNTIGGKEPFRAMAVPAWPSTRGVGVYMRHDCPSRFDLSGAAHIAAYDVFAIRCGYFIELEFDVEALAVLMRPASCYLCPYRFVFFRATFDDAVKLVGRNSLGGCLVRGCHSGFSIMSFVRVKRSAPRINDMVELSRLASSGSQCPLAEGVLRMHTCAALHGLDGRCARRIQNSAYADIRPTSIIAVIRLARILVSPRHFAEHVVDAVYEVIARSDIQMSFAIDDGPDALRIDILGQLLEAPVECAVGAINRTEPAFKGAPTAAACARFESDDGFDFRGRRGELTGYGLAPSRLALGYRYRPVPLVRSLFL